MSDDNPIEAAARRAVDLDAELEAAGHAMTAGAALARSRAVLHDWVESVEAVVASPGVGRVTLIHKDGRRSSIASAELPYLLSAPVRFGDE